MATDRVKPLDGTAAAARVATLMAMLSLAGMVTLPARGQTFTLQEENDTFAMNHPADRAYTNGTRLLWSWPAPARSPSGKAIQRICREAVDDPCRASMTAGIGQSMYTPQNLRSVGKTFGDRPYGGWLYGTFWLDLTRRDTADHAELYLGVIGRDSHAEQAQKAVHRAIHAQTPMGWDNQIGEFAGVLATYEHRILWKELSDAECRRYLDVSPAIGGAVGNVFDYAAAGVTARVGYNLPSRFLRPIPAIATTAHTAVSCSEPAPGWWDLYLFGDVGARWMARNVFIDNQHDSYGIERRPFVHDTHVGISARLWYVRAEYAHTIRSAEFRPDPRAHRYGIITLSIGARP